MRELSFLAEQFLLIRSWWIATSTGPGLWELSFLTARLIPLLSKME